jgi:glycosyltransferase involved in cell wall biosynthesis
VLVSILMTTYNHERYIAEAIESVLSQRTGIPMQLVIAEDASTDHTLDICLHYQALYPDTVVVLPRPDNLGFVRNFCDAWGMCRGKYIAILEGDDLWCSPDKLQRQIDIMEAHPRYSMCFTQTGLKSEIPNRHDQWPYRPVTSLELTASDILPHNLIANCSAMYRASILGGDLLERYPWLLGLPYLDLPLHCLHGVHGPIRYIPEQLATYRMHNGSAFESLPFRERIRRSIRVYEEMAAYLPVPYCHEARQTLLIMKAGLGLLDRSVFSAVTSLHVGRRLPLSYWAKTGQSAIGEAWQLMRGRYGAQS